MFPRGFGTLMTRNPTQKAVLHKETSFLKHYYFLIKSVNERFLFFLTNPRE